MGFPFAFKKSLRSPKRRRRPERSGGQKILKIDLLEALRMALNFSNFFRLFQAIILAQNTSFDQILQSQKINVLPKSNISDFLKMYDFSWSQLFYSFVKID